MRGKSGFSANGIVVVKDRSVKGNVTPIFADNSRKAGILAGNLITVAASEPSLGMTACPSEKNSQPIVEAASIVGENTVGIITGMVFMAVSWWLLEMKMPPPSFTTRAAMAFPVLRYFFGSAAGFGGRSSRTRVSNEAWAVSSVSSALSSGASALFSAGNSAVTLPMSSANGI